MVVLNHLDSRLTFAWKFAPGVPIEVVPFAYAKVLQNLHHILGSPKATLRMAIKKGILFLVSNAHILLICASPAGPVVSDNGNFIIDAPFSSEYMLDPYVVGVPVDCSGAVGDEYDLDHGSD